MFDEEYENVESSEMSLRKPPKPHKQMYLDISLYDSTISCYEQIAKQ